MARTPKAHPETARTELVELAADAAQKLAARIAIGEELLSRVINSPTDLARLESDCRPWSDYNGTMLGRLFSSTEIQHEYLTCHPSPMMHFSGPTFGQEVQRKRGNLASEQECLKSILGRIEL
jgi:hypothetical protein